jgi:hypothetical protein
MTGKRKRYSAVFKAAQRRDTVAPAQRHPRYAARAGGRQGDKLRAGPTRGVNFPLSITMPVRQLCLCGGRID